jgi:phospholipase C
VVQSARADDEDTITPIKHVIIMVGENRTFDHVFATYKPMAGESVNNLHRGTK